MKKILRLLVILFVFMSVNVEAKEIEHFYFDADEDITFSDSVNGSSFLAGESVEYDGNSDGVNFSFGNNVKISGQSDEILNLINYIDTSQFAEYVPIS